MLNYRELPWTIVLKFHVNLLVVLLKNFISPCRWLYFSVRQSFMYEFAETKGAYRHTLPQIRAGEYEKLAERIVMPEWEPDFGPAGSQWIDM